MTTAIQVAKRMGLQLLPDNAQWSLRFYISGSSGNRYTVARRKSDGQWGCSCPGWIMNRKKSSDGLCKHLRAMRAELSKIDHMLSLPEGDNNE